MKKDFRLIVFSVVLLSLQGCGKHETEGALSGAAVGSVVGTAVASSKNKAEGATWGALIGGYLGKASGAARDKRERNEGQSLEVRVLRGEIDDLKRSVEKWCPVCEGSVKISQATTGPHCGHDVITKKYCKECSTTFDPRTNYTYCPYCRGGVRLRSR